MKLIEEYILLTKEERQKHLALDAPCIERGGPQNGGLSSYCKGLMSHILDTTIPSGHKIHICHACNNEKCSNPVHLYWGTAKENRQDQIERGTSKSIFQRSVDKYGYEEACRINSRGKKNNTFGSGNKGKPKSEDQKRKISESIKMLWNKRNADVAK